MEIEDRHYEVMERYNECKCILETVDINAIESLINDYEEAYGQEDDEELQQILDQMGYVMDQAGLT